MNLADLQFDLPEARVARVPPEARGLARDEVRLLVTSRGSAVVSHDRFFHLDRYLEPGDLLVVNNSKTLAASLPARTGGLPVRLHLSTDLRDGRWIAEVRTASGEPLERELPRGTVIAVEGASVRATVLERYLSFARLYVMEMEGDPREAAERVGSPIRYGYVRSAWPLRYYQTHFAKLPGSAEMPSAGRPFTRRVVRALLRKGVQIAEFTLHTGVSSHELTAIGSMEHPVYPEWYDIPQETVEAVERAKAAGRRVIAVGTTAVRALETAALGGDGRSALRAGSGFTELYIQPGHELKAVDGLLTGLHAPVTSHLALLLAFTGRERLMEAYREAIEGGYLWHEFGDVHLLI